MERPTIGSGVSTPTRIAAADEAEAGERFPGESRWRQRQGRIPKIGGAQDGFIRGTASPYGGGARVRTRRAGRVSRAVILLIHPDSAGPGGSSSYFISVFGSSP